VAVDESGQILYQDHDRVVEYMDPSAHTEVNIIRFLCKSRRTTKLKDIALYVTSEPCPVCMGLIIRTKIPFVVYGCDTEPNASLPIPAKDILKHAYVQSTQLLGGVLADECLAQRNASVKSEG
jgi:tRNA(adenine34) deaminase